jgi:hypothetical protein
VGSTWHASLQIDTVSQIVVAGQFPPVQAAFSDKSITWAHGTTYHMSFDRSTSIFTLQYRQTSLDGSVAESDSQGPCVKNDRQP